MLGYWDVGIYVIVIGIENDMFLGVEDVDGMNDYFVGVYLFYEMLYVGLFG